MLHIETIEAGTLDLLKKVQSMPSASELRLVGGTALALHLGHRKSVDLDFFGSFNPEFSFRSAFLAAGHSVDGSENGTVQTLKVSGVKPDFVNYPYEWLQESACLDGLMLAGPKDIAAMKLSAVANRGRKKGFVDMAFLLGVFSLTDIFGFYMDKFKVSEFSFALRGLTYFDDAEADPMPEMLVPMKWPQAKREIETAVRSFVSSL